MSVLVGTGLVASTAFAQFNALPASCPTPRLPTDTPEAAACIAIDHVGRAKLSNHPWGYRYAARDAGGTWVITILPDANIRGGDYTIDVQKKTGAVVGILYGK